MAISKTAIELCGAEIFLNAAKCRPLFFGCDTAKYCAIPVFADGSNKSKTRTPIGLFSDEPFVVLFACLHKTTGAYLGTFQ